MYAQEGYPPTARVGVDGLERGLPAPARRKARRRAAGRNARARTGHARARRDGPYDDRSDARAGRDRRARRQVRRDHGDGPPHGRDRGGGRDRLGRRPAARLDLQDRDRDGRAGRRDRHPVDHLSVRVERRSRRLQDAERRRRGLRRHADQRVRELVRHDVRAARRAARRREAGGDGQNASASTSPTGIAGALRSTIPMADDDRRPARRSAPRRSARASSRPARWRWPTSPRRSPNRGRRPLPTMLYRARPRFVRVTTPKIAGEVQPMMEAVVSYGTGTSAQIPGVTVAGKTGTAELRDTAGKTERRQVHGLVVRGLRTGRRPQGRRLRAVPRPGLRRRHRRAGGQAGDRGRARAVA